MKSAFLLILGQLSLLSGAVVFSLFYFYFNNMPLLILAVGILFGLTIVFNLTFMKNEKYD